MAMMGQKVLAEVGQKVFAVKGRVQLVGDQRDIAVDVGQRLAVYDWCVRNDIELEYQGTLAHTDLWRVRDERQRVMFLLRWS